VLFIGLILVGLAIAEVVVGLVTYGLNLHGQLEYNAASFVGTGFGTIFRFYAYRRWVFLAPGERAAMEPSAVQQVPDYPPWELDSSFFTPAKAAQRPAAPEQLSPWGQEPLSAWSRQSQPAPAGFRQPQPASSRSNQPASSWDRAPAAPVWGGPAAAPSAQRASRPTPAGPRQSGRHRKS
jgi:hypothetical protein